MENKTCTICKTYQPFSNFYRNKAQKDGYYHCCIPCYKKTIKVFKSSEHQIIYLSEHLEKENWKQITFEGLLFNYEISDCGRFRKLGTGLHLNFSYDQRCYPQLVFYGHGKRISRRLHRLVAELFVDNPFNLPQVNHKDGNKLNPHFSNLEWATCKDNIKHAIANGLRRKVA